MVMSAHGLDLTTACARALAAARGSGAPMLVQWGMVTFTVRPGDDTEAAHRAFFAAATEARRFEAERALSARVPAQANEDAASRGAPR